MSGKSFMNDDGESYGGIVPAKQPNKGDGSPAEVVEGRPQTKEGAADKAEDLARCKSLYRQLPEFGRLAYPVRAEVTKHVLPGRKSPGCPAAVCAAVGTTWGATQNWRPEHKEISTAPKSAARTKSFQADYSREADPAPCGEGR
jgi:hypothetical protein